MHGCFALTTRFDPHDKIATFSSLPISEVENLILNAFSIVSIRRMCVRLSSRLPSLLTARA